MNVEQENIKRLFDKLKEVGLLERIFGWSKIKSQLIDATGALQKIISQAEYVKAENVKLDNSIAVEKITSSNLQQSVSRLESENVTLKVSNDFLLKEKEERVKEISTLTEKNNSFYIYCSRLFFL